MPSNFQGNQIAHSQGKRSTKVQQKEIPNQEVPNHQMKPQILKLHKEKVFKNVLEIKEISKITDFNEQKNLFTSLWVQSNMIFSTTKIEI